MSRKPETGPDPREAALISPSSPKQLGMVSPELPPATLAAMHLDIVPRPPPGTIRIRARWGHRLLAIPRSSGEGNDVILKKKEMNLFKRIDSGRILRSSL